MSEVSGTLGFAVLVLGPIVSVAAILLMLVAMRGSPRGLRVLRRPRAPVERRGGDSCA